ncbi:hypothetical protein NDU88_003622 [Pleurodeles waltl]|uniref:Uncharacterized protein n=1 Tax=Pleurodeles waltl TaxID=8319 RepID=A0AAV7VDY2_PLEWA|nr:hypothetical protein NDU88_003622 [Pleurodeles waltl]
MLCRETIERTFPRRSFHRLRMSSLFLGCCPTALTLSTIRCQSSAFLAMVVCWTCETKSWGSTLMISSTMTRSSWSEKRGCLCGAMGWCVPFKLSNVVGVCKGVCILTAAVCTANGIPRLNDRRVDLRVIMGWVYFCWRGGGEGHQRRGAWKKGACVDFSPAHTDLRRYFPRGEVGVVFRRSDSLFLWIAGITRCPGSVRGFSCLFSGCASVCGAARRNYDLTAGVASISPLDFDLRGCALKLRSHGRCRVDFSSRGRAALSVRGRASDLRSSQERRVDQRRSAAFFSPRDKLCVEILGARSVQVKERSLFGPETSRNRRQALSKPLESTFTARQEFSKAAGQQQGSSPL